MHLTACPHYCCEDTLQKSTPLIVKNFLISRLSLYSLDLTSFNSSYTRFTMHPSWCGEQLYSAWPFLFDISSVFLPLKNRLSILPGHAVAALEDWKQMFHSEWLSWMEPYFIFSWLGHSEGLEPAKVKHRAIEIRQAFSCLNTVHASLLDKLCWLLFIN